MDQNAEDAFADLIGLRNNSPVRPDQDLAELPTESLAGPLNAKLPWLIGPCIQPGDCCYFVGLDGHGKTTLVADILVSYVAASYHVLDEFAALAGTWPINPAFCRGDARVLVINAETAGPNAWRHKLVATLAARGIRYGTDADELVRTKFEYAEAESLTLRPDTMEEDSLALARRIIADGYTLVVIDPVFNAFRPRDNADSAWVTHGIKPLVNELKAHTITTFCIAHPNSAAIRFGTKGGPSLDSAFTPFGSFQQRSVMDCRFGIRRAPKSDHTVELIKLKDRRAEWIPKGKARIQLRFAGDSGGYTEPNLIGSDWEIDNPTRAFLDTRQLATFLALDPGAGPFTFAEAVDSTAASSTALKRDLPVFVAQGLLDQGERRPETGRPAREWTWTEDGLAHYRHAKKRDISRKRAAAARKGNKERR